ncbi:MAG TPA: thioredoxin family protein [Burkholderiaceae bacterium]|nr:thioredoxin family protein [Burkholderiaceae bacterium]
MSEAAATTIHVACLCAAWCRLCDGYRAVLESLADEFDRAGVAVQWHWVDIEDEADLVGDLDVETFPTIVVADDSRVRFAGPVEPQRETLQRLLRATVLATSSSPVAPEVDAFARGLRRRQPDRRSLPAQRSSKSA